jgi:hypothetical protein
MRSLLHKLLVASLLTIALDGCSMIAPGPPIHINGTSSLSWSDLREIERLLPALGVRVAITEITTHGPDRADVYCEACPAMDLTTGDGGSGVEFTVVRRAGHWIAVSRPTKSGRVILCA